MPSEIIGRRIRNMLMEYLSANYVLREISNEFEAAGIARGLVSDPPIDGQRRSLVQQYYNSLDFGAATDVSKFLDALSIFMREMERTFDSWKRASDTVGASSYSSDRLDEFKEQLRREGYLYRDGTILSLSGIARLADAKTIAHRFDSAHIAEQIQRMEASIDTDPPLAIGTAKEFVETCFKTILSERGVNYTKAEDLPQLGKKAFKALKLVPDEIPDSVRGAESIRRVLSNLATVVQGMAELRGLYGTGHGKEGHAKGLAPRHARLAVGAASALVTFLFQTHLETKRAQRSKEDVQNTH